MNDFLRFFGLVVLAAGALFAAMRAVGNDYVFYAGYTVLEYVVLACAWNILGGYVGYVNFGSRPSWRLAHTRAWRLAKSRRFLFR